MTNKSSPYEYDNFVKRLAHAPRVIPKAVTVFDLPIGELFIYFVIFVVIPQWLRN